MPRSLRFFAVVAVMVPAMAWVVGRGVSSLAHPHHHHASPEHVAAPAAPPSADAQATHAHPTAANPFAGITEAVAVVHPTRDNRCRGTVRFTQEGDKVRVVAIIEGLDPNGVHGFHVHEYGDCTDPDAMSTGGHYNPEGHPHGGPDDPHRHAGDFGNLHADGEGRARLELVVDNLSVAGMRNPVLGRSVIVHAKADDLKSQPTGDAGARIGCGVIGVAKRTPKP